MGAILRVIMSNILPCRISGVEALRSIREDSICDTSFETKTRMKQRI